MTTENTDPKNSDAKEAVTEQLPVSETIPNPASPEVTVPGEAQTDKHDEEQPQQENGEGTFKFVEGSIMSPTAIVEHEVADESGSFSFTQVMPLVKEDITRPFIDFIEEFRQTEEARLDATRGETPSEPSAPPLSVEEHGEQTPMETKPAVPETRPVSPLLRPASRLRLPRHGGGRQREEQPVAETRQEGPVAEVAGTGVIHHAPTEPPRPTRRYRFDRPAASNVAASTPAQPRTEEGKDAQPKQPATPEMPAANGEGTVPETPAAADRDRRHRQGQDRQRGKEHPAPIPPSVAPVAEVAGTGVMNHAPTEPAAPQTTEEVAVEDLPPLEYSELQRATSRRRRRRRSGETTPATPTTSPKPAGPESPATPTQTPAVTPSRSVVPAPGITPAASQYNIVSGYTVSQMNQGKDNAGPFMSPDPSPARGSVPIRGGLRGVRAEAQRTTIYPVRTGDASLNQFANVMVQALQAQTDRLVGELRRANQTPANVSVSLPALPSTERVGVFVDVANLLYSARTYRITIDFGKLLDFLRGNRRLVRAQAYCPTSPQSGEDQMFLQAVKGLGYRITTKNYKTFSSGAKKADLDLDLCMDVVRLVEGKAVDCIVLVSGDSDFMPMLDYCSDHGVRVEVAAFDEAMSASLRQSCDLFINLALLEEIRA